MKPFTPRSRTANYIGTTKLTSTMLFACNDDDTPDADITLALAFEREAYIPSLDITGGRYACLSIDNCLSCTLEGLTLDPLFSRHGVVIADHTSGLWLDGVLFDQHARGSDIVIGWRPGLVPSSGWHTTGQVVLRDVRAADKKPVTVSVWDAPPPIVQGGNVRVRLMNPRYVRAAQWLNEKGLLP